MNKSTLHDYVHRKLDEEAAAIGGRYTLTEEVRLPFGHREILYQTGWGLFDTTCCGAGGCRYAFVPGFIVGWKTKRNEEGLDVSVVEHIRDPSLQDAVRRLIEGKESVQQVTFL